MCMCVYIYMVFHGCVREGVVEEKEKKTEAERVGVSI